MSTRTVKLTVLNDLICPYCYVGHRELLEAVAAARAIQLPLTFDIEYLPFRLMSNDCFATEGQHCDVATFLAKKMGKAEFATAQALTTKWAASKKVPLTFKATLSQSTQGHRLSRKAYHVGGQRLQLPVLDALFKAYLLDAKRIDEDPVLAEIAEETGLMTRDEAMAFLASDELLGEVTKLMDDATAKGIKGIPLVIIDGKWAVGGVQPANVYLQIFEKLAASVPRATPQTPFTDALVGTGICA